jgi:hypothetical protein
VEKKGKKWKEWGFGERERDKEGERMPVIG